MSNDVWNDDIAYEFSTHRTLMQILGIWPLQKKTVFTIIHWSVIIILQLLSIILIYMDLTEKYGDTGRTMDAIIYISSTVCLILKYSCLAANQRKLAKNINAASDDWLCAKNNEEAYKIMKKHSFESRVYTFVMLYSTYTCGSLYIMSVVVVNIKEIFFQAQMVNASNDINTEDRAYIFPCGSFGDNMTTLQYTMFTIFQIVLLLVVCTAQSITDSFYISLTLHIAGQLKILETKFKNLSSKPDNQLYYRKQFIKLVNRHCELRDHNQNVEDTFHLVILYQLVTVTLLLALSGIRILIYLRSKIYFESLKTALIINFLFMESLLYCIGGDFVQRGSTGIFHAMYTTSWYTLPLTLMKDMNFALMRSARSFQLTGGKFFYVNRMAMVYVLRTAASYISFLRVALKE
ncbi:odorant receptor 63a-like [Solenopsis invicta]|uniref:odorant receptor 63a-like n=1 Tax=Solenopsis invicta TaxID=13686 RepID=UPI00193D266B|nr:odorant receptor 63a-like [Solenopsis invicta]